MILCPLMGAVTYIDEKRRSRTFRFDLIKEHGCSEDIATRLQYVLEKVESMLTSHKSTTSSSEYNVPTLAACRLVIFILATKGYSWICKKILKHILKQILISLQCILMSSNLPFQILICILYAYPEATQYPDS